MAGSRPSVGPPSPFRLHVSFTVDCCFSFMLAIFTGFHESVKVTGVKELCDCQVGSTAPTTPQISMALHNTSRFLAHVTVQWWSAEHSTATPSIQSLGDPNTVPEGRRQAAEG